MCKTARSSRKSGNNAADMDNSASFGMIVKKFRIGWYARAVQKPRPRALKKLFYGALSPPDTARGREGNAGAVSRGAEPALSGEAGGHTAAYSSSSNH